MEKTIETMEEETRREQEIVDATEPLLKELHGYLKNWAVMEPEMSLILGNVRRMLRTVRQEGKMAGRREVVEGIKSKAEEAVDGLYYVRIELLEALTNPTRAVTEESV